MIVGNPALILVWDQGLLEREDAPSLFDKYLNDLSWHAMRGLMTPILAKQEPKGSKHFQYGAKR
jgi:hypothetical protein